MKRTWKPLDVNGLRLYRVEMWFANHPQWNKQLIVAAKSPRHAAALVEQSYVGTEWMEEPVIKGHALNVFQPLSWDGCVWSEEAWQEFTARGKMETTAT
jgi:hypothetical protein